METESPEVLNHKKVEALKRLREADFIASKNKVGIFLLAERLKPACSVELLFQPGHATYTEEDYTWNLQTLSFLLDDLGLPYVVEQSEDEYYETTEFSIGKDEESLQALLDADQAAERAARDRKRGMAFGYPRTAIEAMVAGRVLLSGQYPEELSEDVAIKFVPFLLSRDHWKEELEEVRKQAETIRQKDPLLYQQIAEANY